MAKIARVALRASRESTTSMTRRLPSLNALRVFEAAARQESFRLAAAELHVSDAAVSQQIRKLEEELRVKLFHRGAQGVELTEDGKSLFPAISRALDEMVRATEKFLASDQAGQKAERLTVSSLPGFVDCWLQPRISKFWSKHPEVELEIIESDDVRLLSSPRAEIVIACAKQDTLWWPEMHCEAIMRLTVFPVCAPTLLGSGPALSRLSDLKHHTLLHENLLPQEDPYAWWRHWLQHFNATEVDWSRGPTFNNARLCLTAAIEGNGVALSDDLIAAESLMQGRLVKPLSEILVSDFSVHLLTRNASLASGSCVKFRQWLVGEIKVHIENTGELRRAQPFSA